MVGTLQTGLTVVVILKTLSVTLPNFRNDLIFSPYSTTLTVSPLPTVDPDYHLSEAKSHISSSVHSKPAGNQQALPLQFPIQYVSTLLRHTWLLTRF